MQSHWRVGGNLDRNGRKHYCNAGILAMDYIAALNHFHHPFITTIGELSGSGGFTSQLLINFDRYSLNFAKSLSLASEKFHKSLESDVRHFRDIEKAMVG